MFTPDNFDFKKFMKDTKPTDRKIDKNSKLMKEYRNVIFMPYIVGGILAGIPLILIIYINLWVEEKIALYNILFLFIIGFGITKGILSNVIDMKTYKKIKKIQKEDYKIYETIKDIDSVYKSSYVNNYSDLDYMMMSGKETTKGNIVVLSHQKILVSDKVYDDIMFDKKIKIYILKYKDEHYIYDYDRITK